MLSKPVKSESLHAVNGVAIMADSKNITKVIAVLLMLFLFVRNVTAYITTKNAGY